MESCSLTSAMRVRRPPSPMLTVADKRSPEPSQVSTSVRPSFQGQV
jgi:hypothetical protein